MAPASLPHDGFSIANAPNVLQVNIAEDESEDSAVRRYMKQVVQSKVIDHLRARRRVETKIERYKRRQRERAEARKLGLVEPVWDELYGDDTEAKPFDEFFSRDDEELDIFEVRAKPQLLRRWYCNIYALGSCLHA